MRGSFKFAYQTPAEMVKPLYLQYAKLEEDYGLAKRSMMVYDRATKAVPNNEKLAMYEIYIARATEIFGVPLTRQIYQQAIEAGLPDKDVKTMCLKFAKLERNLGEIDRARALYTYASQLADPRSDADFWKKWQEFEVQHGNEDTFMEMLRIQRSVSASYHQTHFIPPELLMSKDQTMNMDEAKDKLRQAGISEDEMTALERQLAPPSPEASSKHASRNVDFVSAGLESQTADGVIKPSTNTEDIELPDESESDEDTEQLEIAQRDVPSAVFGGLSSLLRKRDEEAEEDNNAAAASKDAEPLGALERMKRRKVT